MAHCKKHTGCGLLMIFPASSLKLETMDLTITKITRLNWKKKALDHSN
jgi:hypothetical protein